MKQHTKYDTATTVMIVDDTPENLGLLEQMLESQGYKVLAFPRGDLALRAAQLNPPLVILLDIMMPEMDGFEVCRRLKADRLLREIPVVFISALDDTASKLKAFTQGGVDFVTKPFQEAEVLARIRPHVEVRQQQLRIKQQARELRKNYELLREHEELRDNLIDLIVHDMRSPLMGIVGNAAIMSRHKACQQDADLQDMLDEIVSSSNVLMRMTTSLLDISRLEADAMPLDIERHDLSEIVQLALNTLGSVDKKQQIVNHAPPQTMVACDAEITRRVIVNLLENALKFSEGAEAAAIHVSVEPAADNVIKVAVQDSGYGIPASFHEQIFEKFRQLRQDKTQFNTSTGLGLNFCKLAVKAQGGEIGLESEAGKGSTFWFTLPAG